MSMTKEQWHIYTSFYKLIEKVDPANRVLEHKGGIPYNRLENGHYYLAKVKGYPAVEPMRPHGQPPVENLDMTYRYFIFYIEEKEDGGLEYLAEAFYIL